MTRWLWLAAPVLVVTLAVPLVVAAAVTAATPVLLVQAVCVTDPAACPANPSPGETPPGDRPSPSNADVAAVLAFAASKAGGPYRMGATGPYAYDCSSLVQAAYAQADIRLPRTAAEQRDWAAAGHATRIPPGQEQPGDLLFWDSWRGPSEIGHVALVWDPATRTTIEARNTRLGIGHFTYSSNHHRFEIWRPR